MHEGYWKVWTRIETVLSWKQHDSLLFPKSSSKTGLQCRSCWKLVGQLWHQKLWLFPVVDRFSQMLASMLKVTQLQFRRKTHTYFLKVPLFGYPATQCYTCQSLCISIQVYPVSPGKGGDKAFMSKLKQNEEKDLWRVFTACPKKLQDRIEKDVDIWYWYVRVAWEGTLPMTQQGKKKSNQWTLVDCASNSQASEKSEPSPKVNSESFFVGTLDSSLYTQVFG